MEYIKATEIKELQKKNYLQFLEESCIDERTQLVLKHIFDKMTEYVKNEYIKTYIEVFWNDIITTYNNFESVDDNIKEIIFHKVYNKLIENGYQVHFFNEHNECINNWKYATCIQVCWSW